VFSFLITILCLIQRITAPYQDGSRPSHGADASWVSSSVQSVQSQVRTLLLFSVRSFLAAIVHLDLCSVTEGTFWKIRMIHVYVPTNDLGSVCPKAPRRHEIGVSSVFYSGCPNQEIGQTFIFKGHKIRTCSCLGADYATKTITEYHGLSNLSSHR
jgi:hypothetical protein